MLTPNKLRNPLVVVFVLCGWEMLAFAMARWLIVRTPPYSADAIVVLSGSSAFRERVGWAAKLYQQGVAPKIILTNDNQQGGWSNALQRNPFFFERSRNQLFELGVPTEAVEVLLQPVHSTHDEALLLRSYCDEHRLGSLLVVTSPYHTRRAKWTFNRILGAQGIRIGINSVETKNISIATWWLHLTGWRTIPLEYMKLVYYKLYF